MKPAWPGDSVGALPPAPKDRRFDFWSGHRLRFRVGSLVGACTEATDRYFSVSKINKKRIPG